MSLPDKASVTTGISAEVLKEMLVTVIKEARKPADPTPEQAAALEQEKEMRKQQAQLSLSIQESKKAEQESCIHCRRDGTTTAVYVQNGNFLICQQCQKIVRPETDLGLFNKLFQMATPAVF